MLKPGQAIGPEAVLEARVKEAEMADLGHAEIRRRQHYLLPWRIAVVAQAAADRLRRAQRVISDDHRQDRRGHGREAGQDRLALRRRQVEFHARAAEAPFIRHPRRQVLQPTEAAARKIAAERRHQRHRHMPFQEQAGPLGGPVVTPIGILRAYGEDAVDGRRAGGEAGQEATNAVAHNMQRQARPPLLHEAQRRVAIQRAPLVPAVAAAAQLLGAEAPMPR
ncbi:hypothetical protein ACFQU7_39255 [Pseudoroseomonas wenyumeiae]